MSDDLYSKAKSFAGFKYSMNPSLNNDSARHVDCSRFASAVVGVPRDTSEGLYAKAVNNGTARDITGLTGASSGLKEGDMVFFDTGPRGFDKGRKYGIDHVAVVVKNPNTGKLELHESVGGKGVIQRDLDTALAKYNNGKRPTKVYAGTFQGKTPKVGGQTVSDPTDKNTIHSTYRQTSSVGLGKDQQFSRATVRRSSIQGRHEVGSEGYSQKHKVDNLSRDSAGHNFKTQYGVKSRFNSYAILVHPASDGENHAEDYQLGEDGIYSKEARQVTFAKLLEYGDNNPQEPYSAYDFLFCKYHKIAPINRMVTLRRYPFATYDDLVFPIGDMGVDSIPPVAQAVTYFGEGTDNLLKEILPVTGQISWEEITAKVHDHDLPSNPGIESDFLGNFIPSPIAKGVALLNGNSGGDLGGRSNASSDAQKQGSGFDYTNHQLGPVNVINKVNVRGTGIGAEYSATLTFEYKLRTYDGINPRIAMLDLIFNLLALSFQNAKFWGGANRFFGGHKPQFGFMGGDKARQAMFSGDYKGYFDATMSSIKNAFGIVADTFMNVINGLLSGDFSALKGVISGVGGAMIEASTYNSRPKQIAIHSLLSGLPTGEWHLTIGNPLHPIARIGNLIVEEFSIELGDELGMDDFPTELKYTVKLKSGRPRDKAELESMFIDGGGRAYNPPHGFMDIINHTSATSSNANPVAGKDNINRGGNSAKRSTTAPKREAGGTYNYGVVSLGKVY